MKSCLDLPKETGNQGKGNSGRGRLQPPMTHRPPTPIISWTQKMKKLSMCTNLHAGQRDFKQS